MNDSPVESAARTEVSPGGEDQPTPIDPQRYRKIRRFFLRVLLHLLWWDLLLNQPLLRRLRPSPLRRWRGLARRYRRLALEMGGVLIKLGQFLSVRVDLLPPEVTRILAGLQDEVPPGPFADIRAQLEADFGRRLEQTFAWMCPEAAAAASLAQVHRATLPSGERVMVKVLRPGIEVFVETDLAALGVAIRWLKPWRAIRRRVDLDRLVEEFAGTTRRELDPHAEGRNAERFADDFADDPTVRIPGVYWSYTAAHTLTLEDVAFIKVTDFAAMETAGVDRRAVARKLYQIYMQQIFVHNFVHADPHPGNLFVRPLAEPGSPGDEASQQIGAPFEIVFVDFGMVAVIPHRLRAALRQYAIGLGTRDAHRVVQAYLEAGALLPGADLKRLEEAHQELFRRFWGVRMGAMRDMALSQASYFLREYRDLITAAPFQIQVDLLFVARAVGLLSGLATSLDPEFDPWAETIPFAEKLAKEGLRQGWQVWLQELVADLQVLVSLPRQVERLLSRIERGEVTFHSSPTADGVRPFRRLERAIQRLAWMVVATGLLLTGVALNLTQPDGQLRLWALGPAAAAFLWALTRRG